MKIHRVHRLGLHLGCALLAAGFAVPAAALQFEFDKVDVQLDTAITVGGSVRLEERSDDLVGIANGGTAFSVNGDDGNLNYDKGDFFSIAGKVTSELTLKHENLKLFARGLYLYDAVGRDDETITINNFGFNPATGVRTPAGSTTRAERPEATREEIGDNTELLDLYLQGDFEIFDRLLTLRVGRQLVSWGESSFIPNGINVVNAFDLSKLRVPGRELRDAFRPSSMLWGVMDLTDTVSVEAFLQIRWDETRPDPKGSYFSTNDFATIGADFVMLGFGLTPEGTPGSTVPRAADRAPNDNEQGGIALRWFSSALGDTEFGLYAMNYHSRLPVFSAISASTSPDSGRYFAEYPEDVKMFGLSFNTTVFGASLSGEYSLHKDAPLQIDDIELLFAALGFPNKIGAFVGGGKYIPGFKRFDISQIQFSLLKTLGPHNYIGANDVVLLFEAGANYVHSMPDASVLPLDAPGTYRKAPPDLVARSPGTEDLENYADDFSTGYRFVAQAKYLRSFAGFNVLPRLIFFHDVHGTTPRPDSTFVHGRKTLGLGVTFAHIDDWSVDFSYNRYFGGGRFNLIHDRDFASANIKYSF